MKNLKTIEAKVKAILQKNEDARNDDMTLYLIVCNTYLKGAGAMPFAEVMEQYKYLGLPSFESVGRTRRKLQAKYPELAVNSVAYMLMSRCGVDTEAVFEREDFAEIINFNTPATIKALGIATSDISEMALREISQTIRDVQIAEKSQNRTFAPQSQTRYDVGREQAERSNHNERNHIHQTRGLSYSRPDITDRARNSAWQIRFDAQGLSGAAQTSDLPQPAGHQAS